MRVMSNAFLSQAEVTQIDRWEYGPLEIQLIGEPESRKHAEFGGRIVRWNSHQCAGYLRDGENLESLQDLGLLQGKNPNVVFAPTRCGYSELIGMLGSLLPDQVLSQHGIERPEANFWLWPSSEELRFRSLDKFNRYSLKKLNRLTDEHLTRLSSIIPGAFEQCIWTKLVQKSRYGIRDFASTSSLRLLAGDTRFWMHRLYRLAIELYESFPPVKSDDDGWETLEQLQLSLDAVIPVEDRGSFMLTRPRIGGDLWLPEDTCDREWITNLLIDGDSTVDSLQPVIDVLLSSQTHEDFSSRYSWIKEDFERTFYSKRSKVKVKLFEFIDDCPVHEGTDTPGYDDILFRDLMAFFNEKDRTIVLALRQGKTQMEIAEQLGHAGHASISRRVKVIENKMRRLLGLE